MRLSIIPTEEFVACRNSLPIQPKELLELTNMKIQTQQFNGKGLNLRTLIGMQMVQSLTRGYARKMGTEPEENKLEWFPGQLGRQILIREECPTLHPSKLPPRYVRSRGIIVNEPEHLDDNGVNIEKMMFELCDDVNWTLKKFHMNKTLVTAVFFKLQTEQYDFFEFMDKKYPELSDTGTEAFLRMTDWMSRTEHERLNMVLAVSRRAADPFVTRATRDPFAELSCSSTEFLQVLERKIFEVQKYGNPVIGTKYVLIPTLKKRILMEHQKRFAPQPTIRKLTLQQKNQNSD